MAIVGLFSLTSTSMDGAMDPQLIKAFFLFDKK
jgi:hypothetical protein